MKAEHEIAIRNHEKGVGLLERDAHRMQHDHNPLETACMMTFLKENQARHDLSMHTTAHGC